MAQPFILSSPYMNYATISGHENAYIQEKTASLANIAEELLPGRGAMVGEYVLFQDLPHRPRTTSNQ